MANRFCYICGISVIAREWLPQSQEYGKARCEHCTIAQYEDSLPPGKRARAPKSFANDMPVGREWWRKCHMPTVYITTALRWQYLKVKVQGHWAMPFKLPRIQMSTLISDTYVYPKNERLTECAQYFTETEWIAFAEILFKNFRLQAKDGDTIVFDDGSPNLLRYWGAWLRRYNRLRVEYEMAPLEQIERGYYGW
jgi:hypothetical protein